MASDLGKSLMLRLGLLSACPHEGWDSHMSSL